LRARAPRLPELVLIEALRSSRLGDGTGAVMRLAATNAPFPESWAPVVADILVHQVWGTAHDGKIERSLARRLPPDWRSYWQACASVDDRKSRVALESLTMKYPHDPLVIRSWLRRAGTDRGR